MFKFSLNSFINHVNPICESVLVYCERGHPSQQLHQVHVQSNTRLNITSQLHVAYRDGWRERDEGNNARKREVRGGWRALEVDVGRAGRRARGVVGWQHCLYCWCSCNRLTSQLYHLHRVSSYLSGLSSCLSLLIREREGGTERESVREERDRERETS